jgi:uncharacterized membrane protein
MRYVAQFLSKLLREGYLPYVPKMARGFRCSRDWSKSSLSFAASTSESSIILTRAWKVISAFCVTSVGTLAAIVVGYFLDLIRDEGPYGLLNDLDIRIIQWSKSFSRHQGSPSQPNKSINKISLRDALERFVLALSDQQIITGLAICIIGYSKHCYMSTYHFFVIIALAWFSSTTHLSTLTLLHHYLFQHAGLKYTRLVGMFALYIMLFVGLLVLYTSRPFQVPVQCRLKFISLSGNQRLSYLTAILLFFFLTITYISKFVKLCFPGYSVVTKLVFRNQHDDSRLQTSDFRRRYYTDRLANLSRSKSSNIFKLAQKYRIIFNFVYLEFLDSFLWQIVWLFFGNFYGIRQLYWAKYFVGQQITLEPHDGENSLNFGQLLTLLILVLPVLAAIEAFFGR